MTFDREVLVTISIFGIFLLAFFAFKALTLRHEIKRAKARIGQPIDIEKLCRAGDKIFISTFFSVNGRRFATANHPDWPGIKVVELFDTYICDERGEVFSDLDTSTDCHYQYVLKHTEGNGPDTLTKKYLYRVVREASGLVGESVGSSGLLDIAPGH